MYNLPKKKTLELENNTEEYVEYFENTKSAVNMPPKKIMKSLIDLIKRLFERKYLNNANLIISLYES